MTEPRWLNDEQQHAWRRFIAVAMLLPYELESQLQRDADLTHFEYWLLAILSEAPGGALRMSDLAAQTNASQSRTSHAVGKLESRGWVRRERTNADGRGNVAVLTDAGFDKVREVAPGHVATVQSLLFDALTDAQVRQLDKIATAILQRLDPGRRLAVNSSSTEDEAP